MHNPDVYPYEDQEASLVQPQPTAETSIPPSATNVIGSPPSDQSAELTGSTTVSVECAGCVSSHRIGRRPAGRAMCVGCAWSSGSCSDVQSAWPLSC
eukprot:2536032-Amphidinium_carterae.1